MPWFLTVAFLFLCATMNYKDTLDFMYNRLPMFSRIGAKAIKADLINTLKLCQIIGNPQEQFQSIHIAGTNGKGSTSHMLAAVMQSAGYKTGLYTSPHLKDFRERIRVNGEFISQDFVVDFIEKIKPAIETIEPSFFEITVAMAFDYFAKQKIEIAIIETGLGGRLDSTNIVDPILSVITNIGWDHMDILGDTLQKIAFEKAGIIKKNRPVIIGESNPDTDSVFEQKAKEEDAPIVFADQQSFIADWQLSHNYLEVEVAPKNSDERKHFRLDLTGYYQTKNLLSVLESVKILRDKGFDVSDKHLSEGLSHTKKLTGLHGRWEKIADKPAVILDVAHNADGMRQLAAQLELTDFNKLHIVIGMVKDKDITKALSLLPKEANYYFTRAHIPRALPEDLLQEQAAAFDLHGRLYPDVNSALETAKKTAEANDLILVCGSVFVVGEVN